MKWTAQQDTALMMMSDFIRDPSRFMFRLWGDPGTGKTTMAAEIRDRFSALNWLALAYTGKAASRLRQKGWCNAGTMHAHMYVPGSKSRTRLDEWEARRAQIRGMLEDGAQPPSAEERDVLGAEDEELARKIQVEELAIRRDPVFVLNQDTDLPDYDVLVIDEVSMVGTKEGADLTKICRDNRIKLILMGDPWQLPPVKQEAYFMDVKPDYELTDIVRQAKDDPILWLARLARDKKALPLGSYGLSKVVERISTPDNSFHTEQMAEFLECDQLLVGTNDTRRYCNKAMRGARGYTDELHVGEKLICLANSKQGFFNGSIWYCQEILEVDEERDRVIVTLSSDDPLEDDRVAKIHRRSLRGEEIHFTERSGAECMVSAEATTVHKFQGSEGKHIVGLDESWTARQDAHRWLYTLLTRAQERVTMVVKKR